MSTLQKNPEDKKEKSYNNNQGNNEENENSKNRLQQGSKKVEVICIPAIINMRISMQREDAVCFWTHDIRNKTIVSTSGGITHQDKYCLVPSKR